MYRIEPYSGQYDDQIIDLILGIQNDEAGIGLYLDEQPDLKNIQDAYQQDGGEFWLALEDDRVIGTIGLMLKGNECAVLKKFFVDKSYRSKKIGLAMYQRLLAFAEENGIKHIILDTPSIAVASHRFYERSGFRKITREELPVPYEYPDRQSILYMLDL